MPWDSIEQMRWGNSPAGIRAMGQAKVDEFNQATKGMKLPKRSPKARKKTQLSRRGKKIAAAL